MSGCASPAGARHPPWLAKAAVQLVVGVAEALASAVARAPVRADKGAIVAAEPRLADASSVDAVAVDFAIVADGAQAGASGNRAGVAIPPGVADALAINARAVLRRARLGAFVLYVFEGHLRALGAVGAAPAGIAHASALLLALRAADALVRARVGALPFRHLLHALRTEPPGPAIAIACIQRQNTRATAPSGSCAAVSLSWRRANILPQICFPSVLLSPLRPIARALSRHTEMTTGLRSIRRGPRTPPRTRRPSLWRRAPRRPSPRRRAPC